MNRLGRNSLHTVNTRIIVNVAAAVATAGSLQAAAIFSPSDAVLGGIVSGGNFVVGTVGTTASTNNWPTNEPPTALVDGVGQKYLNFFELGTGAIITPTFNSGAGSVATSIKLWTANDAEPRDPSSYELWGTNTAISGSGPFSMASFTQISAGSLALPSSRNAGGLAVLDDANSQTISFANTTGYKSYLIMFPTVKDSVSANSMQIAEVQLFGDPVPEPGTLALGGLALLGFMRRRRA